MNWSLVILLLVSGCSCMPQDSCYGDYCDVDECVDECDVTPEPEPEPEVMDGCVGDECDTGLGDGEMNVTHHHHVVAREAQDPDVQARPVPVPVPVPDSPIRYVLFNCHHCRGNIYEKGYKALIFGHCEAVKD